MNVIIADFRKSADQPTRLYGTAYRFSHIKIDERNNISAVFTREVGLFDDVTPEEAPPTSKPSIVALRDFFIEQTGEGIATRIKLDGKYQLLYPKAELKKAMEEIKEIPADVLALDFYVKQRFYGFTARHAWPYKSWDYKGLKAVAPQPSNIIQPR